MGARSAAGPRRAPSPVQALGWGPVEERYVGRTGLRVSRLGLGTLTWGRDTDEHEAADLLTAFLDAGGTLLDTAAGYGDGAAESLLGQLLATTASRDDVVICTKAGLRRRSDAPFADVSRAGMLGALDRSLKRLGVDHVDVWLTQVWSDAIPLEETLSALHAAVRSGRARYAGVSNFAGWQTATAVATARFAGYPDAAPAVAQVEYSLVERGVEREVVPACRSLGVGMMAWSPLGRGVLTGKYRSGTPADSRGASPHLSGFVSAHLNPQARRTIDAVCTAAEGLSASPLEVALAWVRDRPGVASVLVGARTAGQLRAVLASEELTLPEEIVLALDDVSAPPMGYPERF